MFDTLNWLALTIPFIAAGSAYGSLQERKLWAVFAAAAIMVAVFAVYSYMYRAIGFPLWMRWLA